MYQLLNKTGMLLCLSTVSKVSESVPTTQQDRDVTLSVYSYLGECVPTTQQDRHVILSVYS